MLVACSALASSAATGHDLWLHEVDDIADVAQQVFEIQLPFSRPANYLAASPRR
jgi:hypothetical protein